MKRSIILAFAILVAIVTCSVPAQAQTVYATLTGTSPGYVTTAVVGTSSTGANLQVNGLAQYQAMGVTAVIQGGSGGTLDVYIQTLSSDANAVWTDLIHFTQLADGASAVTRSVVLSKNGTTSAITTTGTNLTPGLASGAVLGGNFGDQVRVVYATGTGTILGKVQSLYFWFSK